MRDLIEFIAVVATICALVFGAMIMGAYYVESKVCTAYGEKLNIETDYDYQCFIKDNGAWKLKPVASQEGE